MYDLLRRLRYELLRGLAYRQIEHPEMRVYTTWLPLVISLIGLAIYAFMPERPSLLGKDGVLSLALTLLSTLPGFYFAGLAAVSTFGGADMDKTMPAPPPTIEILVGGRLVRHELSRRQFLSYLFSYLVLISLILWLVAVALISSEGFIIFMETKISTLKTGDYLVILIKYVSLFAISFISASMLITTLHGVFFLSERIHQP